MPAEVPSSQRRREIGLAALSVLSAEGASRVTVRAVAARLGGSTSRVTHYVRTRRDLLLLAFEAVQEQWESTEESLATLPAPEQFRELLKWGADWTGMHESALANLQLHILTEASPDETSLVQDALQAWSTQLHQAAVAAEVDEPGLAADLAYLISRGSMLASQEHPTAWSAERLAQATGYLERLLRLPITDADRPTSGRHTDAHGEEGGSRTPLRERHDS